MRKTVFILFAAATLAFGAGSANADTGAAGAAVSAKPAADAKSWIDQLSAAPRFCLSEVTAAAIQRATGRRGFRAHARAACNR